MKSTKKKPTLIELRAKCKAEAAWIGIKPYSHNIVGLILTDIAELYGDREAEKAIDDFGLKKKGWS